MHRHRPPGRQLPLPRRRPPGRPLPPEPQRHRCRGKRGSPLARKNVGCDTRLVSAQTFGSARCVPSRGLQAPRRGRVAHLDGRRIRRADRRRAVRGRPDGQVAIKALAAPGALAGTRADARVDTPAGAQAMARQVGLDLLDAPGGGLLADQARVVRRAARTAPQGAGSSRRRRAQGTAISSKSMRRSCSSAASGISNWLIPVPGRSTCWSRSPSLSWRAN